MKINEKNYDRVFTSSIRQSQRKTPTAFFQNQPIQAQAGSQGTRWIHVIPAVLRQF